MKFAVLIARLLLGMIFLFFGLNAFAGWIPLEEYPPGPPEADEMLRFLYSSFIMELLAVAHIFVGLLLVINRFVPLALALLFPQIVPIVVFHILVDPGLDRAIYGYISALLFAFLFWAYRAHFEILFYAKADPEV
jgi:uncharacterized membrane protein YphA (DoxX/SURF4 family)